MIRQQQRLEIPLFAYQCVVQARQFSSPFSTSAASANEDWKQFDQNHCELCICCADAGFFSVSVFLPHFNSLGTLHYL